MELAIGITILLTLIASSAITWLIGSKKVNVLQQERAVFVEKNASLSASVLRLEVENGEKISELGGLSAQLSVSKEELAQAKESSRSYENQFGRAALQQEELKATISILQKELSDMKAENSGLRAEQKEKEESYRKQVKTFEEQKLALKDEFENLANKIFEEKGKTFTENNKSSLDAMLKPFKDQIEGFQKRTNEIHDESVKGNTNLEAEIRKVLEVGMKIQDDATNLTAALKGDSQQRGAWGEAQLERTLQMSGLVEGDHYDGQKTYRDDEGKQKRTDYVIKLPNDKHMVIDSKVSLLAYEQAVSAETEEKAKIALDSHAASVRKHIDDLASKEYTNLKGIDSPSFILMFMPIEPAYIEALKYKKDLFSYGYEKGVVLVSHTTLIPILKTVANLWILQESNLEARALGDKAVEIYSQVCTVADRLRKLGNTLGTVNNHYNETVKALAGQQGLVGKVDRFKSLSSKVAKNMPELEPLHADIEHERLDMVIEAAPLIEINE